MVVENRAAVKGTLRKCLRRRLTIRLRLDSSLNMGMAIRCKLIGM